MNDARPAPVGLLRRAIAALAVLTVAALLLGALGAAALFLGGLMHGADREVERIEQGLAPPPAPPTPALAERGAYLARIANCAGCHTAPGGAPYAGGRPLETPFGTVYASNLTPDPDTGLGRWTPLQFRRAMHEGRSRDGRPLLPAFPYTNYTRLTEGDVDALWAYLRTLTPVAQPRPAHALRFPYNTRWALVAWRTLYFESGRYVAQPRQSVAWNRGAYLVQGAGHCSACHGPRDRLGGNGGTDDYRGGLIPGQGWYAPSLRREAEAGLVGWPADQAAALLRDGVAAGASTLGPMAEVVLGSTQHLNDDDLAAMVTYLQALPPQRPEPAATPARAPLTERDATWPRGAQLYRDHCSDCHGDDGRGRPGRYPPLAGNRAVTMEPPVNVVRVVLAGGYPPSTAGHPRPHGMPPFATQLSDDEIAAVVSYVRGAWGAQGSAVTATDVNRLRGSGR